MQNTDYKLINKETGQRLSAPLHEVQTINSIELAEMLGKEHKHVIRDINKHVANMVELNKQMAELGQPKIGPTDYFIEGSYLDSQNRKKPCFHVTKLGCDYYANKMTGIKGAEFTVKYMQKFEEMKQKLQSQQVQMPALTVESLQQVLLASNQSTIQAIANTFTPVINNISEKVVSMESRFEAMERQTAKILNCVKFDSKDVMVMSGRLRNKLSELHGYRVDGASVEFKVAKKKLFAKYEVRKWEELSKSQFEAVSAEIDDLSDPNNIEF